MKAGIANLAHSVYTEFRNQGEDVFLLGPEGAEITDATRQFALYRRPSKMGFQWHIHVANSLTLRRIIREKRVGRLLFMDAAARCYPLPWVPKVFTAVYVNGTELIRGSFLAELASGRFHLLSRAYRISQEVLCNSKATRELYRCHFPDKPARVLYPCFDEKRVYTGPPADDSPYENSSNTLKFLTVSRLAQRKGHEQVMTLLAHIRHRLPPFRYYIVGKGPYRGYLEAVAARLDLRDHVTYTGAIPDEQLKAYYRHADIFIMLSQTASDGTEGFGLTFVEASASGAVVVGSECGGVVEAINPEVSGIILPNTSLNAAAESLLALSLDSARRDRMRQTGPAWTRENFSCGKFYQRWKEIVGEVV